MVVLAFYLFVCTKALWEDEDVLCCCVKKERCSSVLSAPFPNPYLYKTQAMETKPNQTRPLKAWRCWKEKEGLKTLSLQRLGVEHKSNSPIWMFAVNSGSAFYVKLRTTYNPSNAALARLCTTLTKFFVPAKIQTAVKSLEACTFSVVILHETMGHGCPRSQTYPELS